MIRKFWGVIPKNEFFVVQAEVVYYDSWYNEDTDEFLEERENFFAPGFITGFNTKEEMMKFIENPPAWVDPEMELWGFSPNADLEQYLGRHTYRI